MKIVSFDSFHFTDNSYWVGVPDSGRWGTWAPLLSFTPRQGGASLATGGTFSERTLPVEIGYTGSLGIEAALLSVLGRLDPTNLEPRTLVATLNDGTVVQCQASVTFDEFGGGFEEEPAILRVSFVGADPVWRAQTVTATDPTSHAYKAVAAGSGYEGFGLPNNGAAKAWPVLKITPSSARTGTSAYVGWRYRKQATITNNTTRDWHNVWQVIDFGDSAALVAAGKIQAGCNDLVAMYSGKTLPHKVECTDTIRTWLYVCVTIPAGTAITIDLIYGNASHTTQGDKDRTVYGLATSTLGSSSGNTDWTPINLEGKSYTASAGGASTITVTSPNFYRTNKFRGGYIQLTGGTGSGQRRKIVSHTLTVITVDRAWSTNPDATTTFNIWMSGIAVTGGKASSGAASTLTDSSQAFGVNEWATATVTISAGTGSGQFRTVSSNTATVLTVSSNWSTPPDATSVYYIERYGVWQYFVDDSMDLYDAFQDYYGGWAIGYSRRPGKVRYADKIPGGWSPVAYLDNTDDFAQSRFYKASTDNFGSLRARRRRGQDGAFSGEGVADGVMIYNPMGYDLIYWDYQRKNQNGICKLVLAGQQSGGEDWVNIVEDTTTQASLTAVAAQYTDLTPEGSPVRLYMGVIPADEVLIPVTASVSDQAEMRWYQNLRLYSVVGSVTIAVLGPEVEIYDLQGTIYLGGGPGHATPYSKIAIGGFYNGRACYVPLTQTLKITTDPDQVTVPPIGVYDGLTLQSRIPWAAVPYRTERDIDGEVTSRVSPLAFAVKPGAQRLTNPSADSDTTGWADLLTDADVTAAFSRDAGVFYGATAGAFKINVTANVQVGVNQLIRQVQSSAFSVVAGEFLEFGYAVRTANANLDPDVVIKWYSDAAGTALVSTSTADDWTPAVDTWYFRSHAGTAPATAVSARIILELYSDASGATGATYWDTFLVGYPVTQYVDTAPTTMGDTGVVVEFYRGWIA